MDRREFIQKTIAAASVCGLPSLPSVGSSGEHNERMFDEALTIIQNLAGDLFHPAVVRTTIDSINQIGEWGQCAMYTSLFSNDPNTRQLAIECMVADHESYHEYWSFFTELDQHEDEAIKRLAPVLLRRLEDFHEGQSSCSVG